MQRFYILTDLEGAAGVSRWDQTREPDAPGKPDAMRLLTWEVNACVDGILAAVPGADVVVLDGHGSGGIAVMELHPRARLIAGRGMRPPYGLDASFAALFFVGQHAMAGTPDAPLCHTFSSRTVEHYRLNGQFIGEFGCRAALAGAFGVPTVFLSGDDKACAEARALVPGIYTVATKEGMGIELALHLSPATARERIRHVAETATRHYREIPPYVVPPPLELEVRVQEGCSLEGYLRRGFQPLDDRTAVKRADDIRELAL